MTPSGPGYEVNQNIHGNGYCRAQEPTEGNRLRNRHHNEGGGYPEEVAVSIDQSTDRSVGEGSPSSAIKIY